MQEPIYSKNPTEKTAIFSDASTPEKNVKGPRTPKNSPNPKHLGIGVAIALVIAAIAIFLLIPKDTPVKANEFNENAQSSRQLEGKNPYVEIVDLDIVDERISPETAEELAEKASLFFTYVYPDITTLTVKKTETVKSDSPEEVSDEENPIETKTLKYYVTSNNGKNFILNIITASNLYNSELSITDNDGNELYSYLSGSITVNPYTTESESLLDALITILPYSGETDNGEKFDITFEGDAEDRLTISAEKESDVLSTEACENAIAKAVKWANSLTLNFYGEITADRFVCE